jgi:hypothetical protein
MGRGTVVAPLTSRGRPALCGRVSNNAYQNRAFEMGKIAASASFTPGKMLPVAVTAAAVASKPRRLMLNGKSRLAIMPSCERRAGAPATFADLSATSPFPGDHRLRSRLVKVPALS